MGKGVGQILGIVAAIVVPFVAGPIAGAIGLSAAIGESAGAALVGAGLGAGASAATGGNPLLGAVGGAFGGYMANGGWDQVAGAGKSMFGGLFEGGGVTPGSVDPLTGNFYEPMAQTAGLTAAPTTFSESGVYANADPNFLSVNTVAPPPQQFADIGSFDTFTGMQTPDFNFQTVGSAGDPTQVAGLGESYSSPYGATMNDAGGYLPNTQVASVQPAVTDAGTTTVSSTPYGADESVSSFDKYIPKNTNTATGTGVSGQEGFNPANYNNRLPIPKGQATPYTGSPDAGLFPGQSYTAADLKDMSGVKLTDSGGVTASGSKGIFGDMGMKDILSLAGNAAKLGMTMFNKAPQQLTAAEQAAVQDAQRLASENQALFAKRVEEARSMWSEGTPKPEQAFAQTGMTVERRLMDAQRGKAPSMQTAEARRAAIEGTRLGTLAVSEDAARSRAARQTAMNALPTTAPTGAAGLALPIYAALDKRRAEYARDLSNAAGGMFGGMFGGSSGRYA